MKGKTDHADRGATCLVVDDEPAMLRLISILLEDMGCQTMLAPNAEAALEILGETAPDLMIADVRLPGVDGVELTRAVKANENFSSMPVLLMSAYGEPRGHSGDDFLAKPFDIDTLTDFVAPYIEQQTS